MKRRRRMRHCNIEGDNGGDLSGGGAGRGGEYIKE